MKAVFPRCLPPLVAILIMAFGTSGQTVRIFHGEVPAAVNLLHLKPVGQLPGSQRLNLAIGLPLRNQTALNALLAQIYDPTSTNYRHYLTPDQFTERFGPTKMDYQTVTAFLRTNGFSVVYTHPNRVVLDVNGSVADIERVFHVTMCVYQHPREARTFFAPDAEPSIRSAVPILHISGLDDYSLPHPMSFRMRPTDQTANAAPQSGSGPSGTYAGYDFRSAYVPGTTLNGSGQSVALVEFDGYYANDIATYVSTTGLPGVTLTNVAVDGGVSKPGSGNAEVALDIEMAISMAPGLSRVIIYEAPNPSPWADLFSRIANDNLAKQISCSWGGGSPDPTSEQLFKQMAAQGQSFFNASGDSDAFVGSVSFPSDSTNITQVGGTTLTTTGPGGSWSSETVWNWGRVQGQYVGSSGGVSTYYSIPFWQQGISMTANQGSTTMRNIPDVALTADNIWVTYNNGQSGGFGGTSCAAPLWAAFTALANQQAEAAGETAVGFINPAVYAIGKGPDYATDFHDITTGNNFSRSSPTKYAAVSGFDLCTGWGTPKGINLINALAPSAVTMLSPTITVPPMDQMVQCGDNATFHVAATGTAPLGYQWSVDGAPVAGETSTNLTLTNVHLPDHLITVVVTNLYGSVTNFATLTVQDTIAPVITLNGADPLYVELGSGFVDPGATAVDLCAGPVPVTTAGTVNTAAVGTNIIAYTATDGNGNTNTTTRAVIVRDTTPPTILQSFTNLVLAAGANCDAVMPDVTGTNFIEATDLSGSLTISQNPTNDAILPLGTNLVIITVADASGNTAYSTNAIVVQDQTPPVILIDPQDQTNIIGTTANFTVGATACTPLKYQWFFDNAILTSQTNESLTLSNVTTVSAGNYFAVASAEGGATTSRVATLTIKLISPALVLASSENPSGFKESVNITARVAPTNATGMLQFLTNGIAFDTKRLVAGIAVSTNISSLPRGTNVITAVYSGDVNDSPATNTLEQVVTNHPPIAAAAFYNRLAGYPLDVPLADLATNWSDTDGDTVSLAAIGVSTNGVTVTNNVGALVYFDTNNVDDEFICTVSDGWGGTNFQTIHITVVLTNVPPVITGLARGSNGAVTLNLGGAPGYTYVLETTTNLAVPADWQPLNTNTPGTNGLWQFTDDEVTNFPERYFRLMLAPQ